MLKLYDFKPGNSPLIVSMPHSGTGLPADLAARLSEEGASLPDTDWHIPRLYNFLEEMDATIIQANYSRYVVDLNRLPDGSVLYPGQSETQICPTTSFQGVPLYQPGRPFTAEEVPGRVEAYWQPYHDKLAREIARLKSAHGFAMLWDAHSIRSRVPRFFEGTLPDLNLGTADGASCDPGLSRSLMAVLEGSDRFSSVCNGRFKGGAITRSFGDPAARVHAVQMEIAQRCYMSETADLRFEEEKANHLRPLLRELLSLMLEHHG